MPFGLGFGETILIFLMLVLLFGPGKLPELGDSLGRGIRDFRKALNGADEEAPPRLHGAPTLPPPDAAVPTLEPPADSVPTVDAQAEGGDPAEAAQAAPEQPAA